MHGLLLRLKLTKHEHILLELLARNTKTISYQFIVQSTKSCLDDSGGLSCPFSVMLSACSASTLLIYRSIDMFLSIR